MNWSLYLLLSVCVAVIPSRADTRFSWQEPQAKVLPTGALEWMPRPFVFVKGDSVKYIDFAAGSDASPGTQAQPWQHHPWDTNAVGQAKACRGIHTYVFKRGVIYRGALQALESGTEGNPIRLTSDPAWGTGEAALFGSVRVPANWRRCTAADASGIPDPTRVWFNDVGVDFVRNVNNTKLSALWRVKGQQTVRINIARAPNWTITDPDDPTSNWYPWESYYEGAFKGLGWMVDKKNWVGKEPGFFAGAEIWTQGSGLTGTVHNRRILEFDATKMAFKVGSKQNKPAGATIPLLGRVRYYMENVREFLDAPGEYYFDVKSGRLYLRLDDDSDPNQAVLEAAHIRSPVQIWDHSNIDISGLTFRFNTCDDGLYGFPGSAIVASPGVRIVGSCSNITVRQCRFYNVMNAVVAFTRPYGNPIFSEKMEPNCGAFADDVLDHIVITDNDVRDNDMAGAIWVEGNCEEQSGRKYGILKQASVLRNRVVNSGARSGKAPWGAIPAITVVLPETGEVAGNIVDTSWGTGINVVGGKCNHGLNEVGLTRILVHHNQVENTMLGCNDYGGIEAWQGGPIYIFNNISRNAVGTRTFEGAALGYNLYLDGGFKMYSFNNILAGKIKPDQPGYYNNCGYFMVFGFLDHLFNNTIYHFQYAMNGSSGNRSCILGNVMVDAATTFIGQNRPGDASMMAGGDTGEMGRIGMPTMVYGNNVFWGKPQGERDGKGKFGFVGGTKTGLESEGQVYTGNTLDELRDALQKMHCRVSSIGQHVSEMPLRDPARCDYRLTSASAARHAGVKFFVPWGLSRTVGEWNFYQSEHHPQVVLGENFYLQDEHIDRGMYYFTPRNDLTVSAATPGDYISGPLEDWIPGALQFDGQRTAVLTHGDMTRDMECPIGIMNGKVEELKQGTSRYDGHRRKTLDMDTNNFLIEAVFLASAGGVIAEKMQNTGYCLQITPEGGLTFSVGADSVTGGNVHDGRWHHVIAEADRVAGKLRLYLDGKKIREGDATVGSLANTADFIVGRGFVGALDFLRVSRGTLADARTTIEELYAWEFNGPQLRDFCGNAPIGKRDAGALESMPGPVARPLAPQ